MTLSGKTDGHYTESGIRQCIFGIFLGYCIHVALGKLSPKSVFSNTVNSLGHPPIARLCNSKTSFQSNKCNLLFARDLAAVCIIRVSVRNSEVSTRRELTVQLTAKKITVLFIDTLSFHLSTQAIP